MLKKKFNKKIFKKENETLKEETAIKEPINSHRDNDYIERHDEKKDKWYIKVTIMTFVLAALFSTISEFTVSKSGIIIAILLLLFLIILSILFDGIAVATTSCDISLIMALAARKVPHTKQAILLVKNAGKVANVCADVIGDICGIISGACGSTIISQLLENSNEPRQMFYAIIMSSVIAALTVGGKGSVKKTAIKNSKEFVMVTARILSLIYKAKKK